MTLYFDCRVENPYHNAIVTNITWHPSASCLAVATYSKDKGGTVDVYNGEGKHNDNVEIPQHPTAEVNKLKWHPIKRILAVGWESGELVLWNDEEGELHQIQSLHQAPVSILHFSSSGTRLVSADKSGNLVGWKADNSGSLQRIFSHELKDPPTEIVFRCVNQNDKIMSSIDLNGLARAAVGGDEIALDIFSSWRPKTGHKRMGFVASNRENLNFYLGAATGVIYHISESGQCTEELQAEGGIRYLLHHESKNILVVITEGLTLGQYAVNGDGSLSEISKVKLSGRASEMHVTWTVQGILAVSAGNAFVRLWNLETGENFVLDLQGPSYRDNEIVTCLGYSATKKLLCAGTKHGNIAMWKYEEHVFKEKEYVRDAEKEWVLQNPSAVNGSIKQIEWGSALNLLAVNSVRDVYILNEQEMVASYNDLVSVVQVAPTQLSVDLFSADNHMELRCDIQVRGAHNSVDHILLWNNKTIVVYEITADSRHLKTAGSFPCESDSSVIHENSIYSIEASAIQVRSLQGTIKQTLSFSENEGYPIGLNICGNYMVTSSINGYVKLWDLSRREVKVHSPSKNMNEFVRDFGEIISAMSNCNGTKVSIAVAQTSLMPDPKLYFWDVENDHMTYFNFASGRHELEDTDGTVPPNSADSSSSKELTMQERTREEIAREVGGRFVMSHSWDPQEPRLIACEAKMLHGIRKERKYLSTNSKENQASVIVVSLFVSSDYGIVVQDMFPLVSGSSRLLGIQVPYFYILNPLEIVIQKKEKHVIQKTLRDFVGLEDCDKNIKEAMLNFSFHLSIGNMDEAFKAIKAIKSKAVWENMAKMCVKTKRLDVAFLCLGNMGHARGARALRLALEEPEVDARVAMLAVQLNMLDEAERLYTCSGRLDLLNKFYQDKGIWSKAISTAETNDRIHLRSTHYNYAKHLESKGDLSGAIIHYELSDTHRFEVPRMLFDELPTLVEYIMQTNDKQLRRWWAQYLESTGEMETALQFYEAAEDHLSLVRVHCYCNNLEAAAAIANETGDRAACYHLARQYENVNMVREAIHFFTRAQAYGNAIRICKENSMDDQLLNLALTASSVEQLDAARYFLSSERPQVNKAVMLYHKAGFLSKAVDLAFQSNQMSAIGQIAGELTEEDDPELITRCAEYFTKNGQYDKAVALLITGKQYTEALDMCVKHNVWITEELAERFTLPKDEHARNSILEKVAECAYAQENYKLATKKYTQAGNKVKAMKSLLKSGDTERIIYFANVCRQPDIYIMAANYLQSLNWRKEPQIMKNIIQFYTRAKATGRLAGFYESCAQVEIDDYQNYEKAAGALLEAYKILAAAVSNKSHQDQEKLGVIQYKLEKIKNFIELKNMLEDDPNSALKELYALINEPDIERAVKVGDIYAVIIEHYVLQGNNKSALAMVEEMTNKLKVNPSYHVSAKTLQAISSSTGVHLEGGTPNGLRNVQDDSHETDEEILEEEIERVKTAKNKLPFMTSTMNGSARFF